MCDFCDGEKFEGIPYAQDTRRTAGGAPVEKELRIGYNGCAMACYGAVNEDIAMVFRKGKFDLFLGGKTTGRSAAPGQRVAEGLPAEEMVGLLERIVQRYGGAFPANGSTSSSSASVKSKGSSTANKHLPWRRTWCAGADRRWGP